MAMVVKNNMSAVNTLNTLNRNQSALGKSLQKVSSGLKINSAQDDASGYGISERMRTMIRSLDQANENTQNGSSLMRVAEGAVGKTVEILRTLKNKAIQSATDTNTDDDRKTIQKEIDQLIDQIDENALITFNGKYLIDGSKTQAGEATYTAMTNQKLALNTTGASKLIELTNRKGESLEIIKTDQVTASFVQNGKTYTTNYTIGDSTLEDIFSNLNAVAVDAGVGKVFGVAQNNTYDAMDYDTASDTIASDAGTNADIVQLLRDTTSPAAKEYVRAATAIVNNDEAGQVGLGSASTTNAYQDVSSARADLERMLESYFGKFAIMGTSENTEMSTVEATLSFKTYDADGNTNTSKFTFSVQEYDNSGTYLSGATGDLEGMVDELSASLNNLLNIGVRGGDTAAAVAVSKANYDLTEAIKTALNFTAVDFTVTNTSGATDTVTVGLAVGTEAGVATVMTGTATISAAGGIGTAAITDSSIFTDTAAFSETAMATDATYVNSWNGDSLNGTGTGSTETASTTITMYATGFVLQKLAGLVHEGKDIGLNPASAMVKTADGTTGLTVTAKNSGLNAQISGLTIKISDAQGQSRTAINEVLDAFGTTIFASNKSEDTTLKIHTGAAAGQAIAIGLSDMRASALGLKGNDSEKVSVVTQDKANVAINVFDNALQKALDIQTTIGAIEARLEYTSDNLTTSSENVQAAESTIRDADMAKEMTNYTKNNVLLQAAQSMLAQANQNSSAVLSLLQ